jgi:glycosyltransferase involved in cell wall biosynthesis
MTMLLPFSVVIPAFNEAGRIGESLRVTLEYLGRVSPESEVIVVNDGSTDDTRRNRAEGFSTAGRSRHV